MAYKIINNFIDPSQYPVKAPYAMVPQFITIHNTGNVMPAVNEATYHNSNNYQVSYHVAIDDKEARQLIPFNRNGWHSGDGNGPGNRTSIGIEICYSMDNGYSGAKSARYKQAEENAALYVAYVLDQLKWGVDRLRRHWNWDGKDCPHKIHATNTWQAFVNRVQEHLTAIQGGKAATAPIKPKPTDKNVSRVKSVATVAKEVMTGVWGNGEERFRRLRAAGYNVDAVQTEVNRLASGKNKSKTQPKKKSNATIAQEVIDGKWGNGNDRFKRLLNAGYNAATIQNLVNQKLTGTAKSNIKSIDTIAREVIAGKWGNGQDRFNRLQRAGYNAQTVQERVNRLL